MDAKSLGKVIKEARLSKKLTQNEVVGTFITRNMLSQIESGTAMPSMKTLEYLCKKLDINLEATDELARVDVGGYTAVREMYLEGRYEEVISAEDDPEFADECRALKALANLELAVRLSESENVSDNQRAVELARRASELSAKGIFANDDAARRADEALKAAASKLSKYYSSFM